MNKNDIISSVSIEFGLSNEQSESTVTNIFHVIAQTLKKNKNLEIKKFGKLKLISDKNNDQKFVSIKFTPSQKLSQRINGNFENLKKIKLKKDLNLLKEFDDGNKTPDDFIKPVAEIKMPEPQIPPAGEVKEIIPAQKKLISEDLIKLHKEIIKEEAEGKVHDDSASEKNLWR